MTCISRVLKFGLVFDLHRGFTTGDHNPLPKSLELTRLFERRLQFPPQSPGPLEVLPKF
jgi:hypothetical protein